MSCMFDFQRSAPNDLESLNTYLEDLEHLNTYIEAQMIVSWLSDQPFSRYGCL